MVDLKIKKQLKNNDGKRKCRQTDASLTDANAHKRRNAGGQKNDNLQPSKPKPGLPPRPNRRGGSQGQRNARLAMIRMMMMMMMMMMRMMKFMDDVDEGIAECDGR